MTLSRMIRSFSRRSDGAVSIEAVLWLPFFIFLVVALGDVALLFHARARALEVMEDGVRLYSVGEIATPGETSQWIEARLQNISPNAEVFTSVYYGLINSDVHMPVADINGFGIFSTVRNFNVIVSTQQVREFAG